MHAQTMARVSDYYYNGKRTYFLVYKFNDYDAELLTFKLRHFLTKKNIPFSRSTPCCGLNDEYFITSVREDDVEDIDVLLQQIPIRLEYGEQTPDENDPDDYYDCFPRRRHCSICKLSGHNKRTCKNKTS